MSKSKFELFENAIADNNTEEVNRLIDEDGDIQRLFTQPGECDKLLSCAISYNDNFELIDLLLTHMGGMKKFAPNTLLFACKQGYVKVVESLLNKKAASVNTITATGTALSNACMSGNKNLVELLIKRGANRHFKQAGAEPRLFRDRQEFRFGLALRLVANINPAINAACAGGHIDIVKLLVANSGPEIYGFDDSMDNPYTSAVTHNQIEMLDYLLENYPLDTNDKIALMPFICEADNPDIIPLLEKYGFMAQNDITIDNFRGPPYVSSYYEELLREICINGGWQLLNALLAQDNTLPHNLIRKSQTYPLCLAAAHGHVDIVDRLIASGANLSLADQYNANPLHVACYSGHIDIIDRLLHAGGFNINAVTSRGETALTLLFKNHDAVSLDIIDRLIVAGINCNHQNHIGQTALILAILNGREDIVQRLISIGVDVNQADCDNTPLMYAVETGEIGIIKLLLAQPNINLGITDSVGQTAIDMADDLNNPEIIALFAGLRETLPSSSQP